MTYPMKISGRIRRPISVTVDRWAAASRAADGFRAVMTPPTWRRSSGPRTGLERSRTGRPHDRSSIGSLLNGEGAAAPGVRPLHDDSRIPNGQRLTVYRSSPAVDTGPEPDG